MNGGFPRLSPAPSRATENGWRRLLHAEVYADATGRIVVCGNPDDLGAAASDAHNCDAMGCGSVGFHIIARARIPGVTP